MSNLRRLSKIYGKQFIFYLSCDRLFTYPNSTEVYSKKVSQEVLFSILTTPMILFGFQGTIYSFDKKKNYIFLL